MTVFTNTEEKRLSMATYDALNAFWESVKASYPEIDFKTECQVPEDMMFPMMDIAECCIRQHIFHSVNMQDRE